MNLREQLEEQGMVIALLESDLLDYKTRCVTAEKERDELRDSLKFNRDYTSALEVARKDFEEEAIQRGKERDELRTVISLIETYNGSIDSFNKIDEIINQFRLKEKSNEQN